MSGFQQLASSTIPKCRERRDAEEQAQRKMEETTSEVSDHDNWPSFALFRFLHADTPVSPCSNVSDRCYPAVPGEGWRKVEVLPHANCARFHPPLLAPIFLALGGGNGKPSKYLSASIYPRASGRRREHSSNYMRQNRDRDEQRSEKGRRKVPLLPKTVPSAVRFRKATAEGKPTCLSGLLELLFFSTTMSLAFPSRKS